MNNKNSKDSLVSGLNQHKLEKKKGLFVPPLNTLENMKPSSWANDRLPEYLWLGLILMHYGRKKGLDKAGRILFAISKQIAHIEKPKFSFIFTLSQADQEIVYKIISKEINPEVLSPLTILYRNIKYQISII